MDAQRHPLPGGRWHLQHGPIDIVLQADGEPDALAQAHEAAWARFRGVLPELVAELPLLRRPLPPPPQDARCPLRGPVARRMWAACAPYREVYITPMAAVAGAVAQELAACYAREGIRRAGINNGGDIALHLAGDAQMRIGLYADLARLATPSGPPGVGADTALDGAFSVGAASPVRGIATSGWHGRSFSRGIADAVTVLARSAAEADAAATIVANAVDAAHPGIVRRPANTLRDDSDLGDIAVTVAVPPLPPALLDAALDAGLARAEALRRGGLIEAALLVCQGRHRVCGGLPQRPLVQSLLHETAPARMTESSP